MADNNSIVGALLEIAERLGPLGGGLPGVPRAAYTDPREELLVFYSVNTGFFHKTPKGPVITIRGEMFSLDGKRLGEWEGVDEPAAPLQQAFQDPPRPQPPFNSPDNTVVDEIPVLSWSKGIWRFDDGSTITAIGPAQLRALVWSDFQGQLWVSGEQIVTGGTGKYEGVQGVKTVSGTAWIPPGPGGSPPDFQKGGEFPARVIEAFRLVRRENQGPPPPLPGA